MTKIQPGHLQSSIQMSSVPSSCLNVISTSFMCPPQPEGRADNEDDDNYAKEEDGALSHLTASLSSSPCLEASSERSPRRRSISGLGSSEKTVAVDNPNSSPFKVPVSNGGVDTFKVSLWPHSSTVHMQIHNISAIHQKCAHWKKFVGTHDLSEWSRLPVCVGRVLVTVERDESIHTSHNTFPSS